MNEAEKAHLLEEIAASRRRVAAAGDQLRTSATALRAKLDVRARVAGSFRTHRPAWLGGAALLGFLLSRLPARSKTVVVDAATGQRVRAGGKLATLWAIAKFSATLAKPWIGNFVSERFTDLARRYTAGSKGEKRPDSNDGVQ